MRAIIAGVLGCLTVACGSPGPQAFLDTDKTALRAISHFTGSPIEIDGREDLAYVWGTYQLSYLAGGTDHGKFVEVRRRDNNRRWLIIADIFNSDVPTTTSSR